MCMYFGGTGNTFYLKNHFFKAVKFSAETTIKEVGEIQQFRQIRSKTFFSLFNGSHSTSSFESDISLIPRLRMSQCDVYVYGLTCGNPALSTMPPQDSTSPGESFVLVTACDSCSGVVTSPSNVFFFFLRLRYVASGPISPSGRHLGNQQLKKKTTKSS